MSDENKVQDPSLGVLLLYVAVKDAATGDEVDHRVGLLSGDRGTVIAESSGDETASLLSRDDVEVISYRLSRGVGLKEHTASVSITNEFPAGEFDWSLAITQLYEEEAKQLAPKMGM
jgi:hypothetical protein